MLLALLAAIALLCLPSVTWASPAIQLDAAGRYDLSHGVELLEDPSRALTIDDVVERDGFRSAHPGDLNVGYSASAIWLRFTLENRFNAPRTWLLQLQGYNDWVDLYEPRLGGGYAVRYGGKLRPFYEREIAHGSLLFPLSFEAGEAKTLYIRAAGADVLDLPLVVWAHSTFIEWASSERLALGIYYGILFAMALYNAFLYLALRERAYLYYVLFQVSFGLLQAALDDLLIEYLWPGAPWLAPRSEIVLAGAVISTASRFTVQFLGRNSTARVLYHALNASAVGGLLLAASAVISAGQTLQMVGLGFAGFVTVLIFASGVDALRRGSENALVFVVGWGVFLIGLMLLILTGAAAIPDFPGCTHAGKVGSAIEAIVLSIGLAHRINRIRHDKERAQDERLADRIAYVSALRRHASALQQRVDERTRELTDALASLQATQASLVKQARTAALGHLVAGVAHEIGNPLNFSQGGAAQLSPRLDVIDDVLRSVSERSMSSAALARANKALSGARRALVLVSDGTDRIRRIIDTLRSYMSDGNAPPVEVDLIAVLDTTLSLLSARLEQAAIRVHKDFGAIPKGCCHPGEINQVFSNLIANSVDAMPDGGEIRIQVRRDGEKVEIDFQDTGPGVLPEHREKIFDPFFTTRAPGQGIGLGLWISHHIVTAHGGTLHLLESERGARFRITLPLAPPESQSR